MKKVLLLFALVALYGCPGPEVTEEPKETVVLSDHDYGFLNVFHHQMNPDYYSELPFYLKFVGIKNSDGEKEFAWLREPDNLMRTFTTFYSIGLDEFVSKEAYFDPDRAWCCNTQWEGMSLDSIVKTYLRALRSPERNEYSKFWDRRRAEGNVKEVQSILGMIGIFYNDDSVFKNTNLESYEVLKALLEQNLVMQKTDTLFIQTEVEKYCATLIQSSMEQSAMNVVKHYEEVIYDEVQDSLETAIILSMKKADTLQRTQSNVWFMSEIEK